MRRAEQLPTGSDSPSPGRLDRLRHVGGLRSPLSPLYLSFFEEECRAIAFSLRLGTPSAAEPLGGLGESSVVWRGGAEILTSTPLDSSPPPDQGPPERAIPAARPSVGRCEAASGPDRGQARRLPQPSASGARSGSLLARPQAPARKVAGRGAGQPPCGGPGPAVRPRTPAWLLGGGGRSRAQASLGQELPKAGRGLGAQGTRLPQATGTRLKLMPAAKTGLKHPSRASQLVQRSTVSKPTPWDAEVESNSTSASYLVQTAVKVGCCKQPSRRLSTAISTVSARSRPRPPGKLPPPKRICLGSRSKPQAGAQSCEKQGCTGEPSPSSTSTDKHDHMWVCMQSSFSSKLAPGPAPWCRDAVLPEQSAGNQLSEELKQVKNELEQVKNELEHVKSELEQAKGELADKITQCEAYCQMISSLQVQLRATGICLVDAAQEESGKG